MFKYFTLFLLIISTIFCLGQEKKIRIVKANSLVFDKEIKDAQQLIGDVVFEHDSAFMYCDTALLFLSSNSFEAFGHVRIVQGDSMRVSSDSLVYLGKEKLAKLKGNVDFTDGKLNLVTSQLNYDMSSKIGSYSNGATITSLENNNVLVSKIGSYHGNSKTLFFKDSVKLTNPKYVIESDTLIYNTTSEITFFHGATTITNDSNFIYCEHGWYDTQNEQTAFWQNAYFQTKEQTLSGDSIYYDRNIGVGEAFGNVLIRDTINKVDIEGDYAFYNEINDSSLVTECALLTQYFDSDTLYLTADTLIIKQDSATQKNTFRCYHHVLLYKKDLQASCDSLVYSELDSMMYFMIDPIIWSDSSQMTGKEIKISTHDGTVERLYINKKAAIISEADSLNNYNQIQGKTIEGIFNKDSEIETIFVNGNGEILYFMGEENKPITDLSHTECANIKITLKDNQIKNIKYYNKAKATMNPLIEVNKEKRKLSYFNWFSSKRPKSKEDLIK